MTTTTTQPDFSREAVLQRVSACLVEGRDLSTLTAAQALGIPQEAIQAALRNEQVRVPRLGNGFVRHRTSTLRQKIASQSPVTVIGQGSREMIAEQVTPLIKDLRLEAVLEMCEHPAHIQMLEQITPGLTTIQFSTKFASTSVRYDGLSFAMARPQVVELLEASPLWEVFNCPWDDRYPAFAVKIGDDSRDGRLGAKSTVVVLLNLFGTAEGQWVRSTNNMNVRLDAFEQIMRSANSLLTNSFRYPETDGQDERDAIRAAHGVFESLKAFGSQALGRINDDVEKARRDLREAEREAEQSRLALLAASQKRHENAERIQLLTADQGSRIAAALEAATNNLERIRNLRAVRSAEMTTRDGRAALHVKMYDVVAKDEQGPNRLCKGIAFYIILDPGVAYPIVFDNTDTPEGQQIHPNVGRGGDICWGQIDAPVTARMAERDWNGVVTLMVRMLQNVGHPVLYSPEGFPVAPAGMRPGFQYPREDS